MWRQLLVGVFVFMLAAGTTIGVMTLLEERRGSPDEGVVAPPPPPPIPKPISAEMRIMLAGTTFWGRRTGQYVSNSGLGFDYPFSGLEQLGRDDFDAWIAGLECPVTDGGYDYYQEEQLLSFNCDPAYLPEAAKWFTAFSLGNNHTDNRGEDGFEMTKQYLANNGIQYFGHHEYWNTSEVCGPVIIKVQVKYDIGESREHSLPVAFCGYHGFIGIPTDEARAEIVRWAEVMPVIAMPHMGVEYVPNSDGLREAIYREMIDLGADMVIADHPHWVQNSEVYNGKLIVYSMGNFMFDQVWGGDLEVERSAAIGAYASFGKLDYGGWDKVSEKCLADKAGCIDTVKMSGLPKLAAKWKFDYRATINNGAYVTVLADDYQQAAVGARLNWQSVIDDGLSR